MKEQAINDPVILHYSGKQTLVYLRFEPLSKRFRFHLNISGLDKSFDKHIPMKARIKARFRSLLGKIGAYRSQVIAYSNLLLSTFHVCDNPKINRFP